MLILIHVPQTSYQRLASVKLSVRQSDAYRIEAAVILSVNFIVLCLAGLVDVSVVMIYSLLLEIFHM
jgi:hypothetical protein